MTVLFELQFMMCKLIMSPINKDRLTNEAVLFDVIEL